MTLTDEIYETSLSRVRTQSSDCRRLLKQLQSKLEQIAACYSLAREQSSTVPLYNVMELENEANSLRIHLMALISSL